MTPRLGFYFDANACIGCRSCESACKEWNGLDFGVRWRQVINTLDGTFPDVRMVHVSLGCNNCEGAPCVKACPTAAMYVDKRLGLVQLDAQKCIGCRYCEWACPYGAIQYDSSQKKVSKCTLCADRLVDRLAPACVTSCPTECLKFGDLNSLATEHPQSKPDFPGLESSEFAKPKLLCEPLRNPAPKPSTKKSS